MVVGPKHIYVFYLLSIYFLNHAKWLIKTGRSIAYQLIYKVVVLSITFPIFLLQSATMKQEFLAPHINKITLCNKKKIDFFFKRIFFILFIEREMTQKYSTKSVIDLQQKLFQ